MTEEQVRMDALLPHVETDRAALLEYAQLWMRRFNGSPQNKLPTQPTTGPWLTRLLIEALASE